MTTVNAETIERLARIETKLDSLCQRFERQEKYRDSRHDDHEQRLRRVERWSWIVAGVIGGATGYVAHLLPGLGG